MALNIFINVFGWTLIHSLWQAAIIFAVLHLLLRIFRHAPSHIKYVLAYSALAGIFLCFLFTFYSLWHIQESMQEMAVTATSGILPVEVIKNAVPSSEIPGLHLFQPGKWIDYFVLLYCAGLTFFTGKVTRDFFIMRRIRQRRIKPFDKAWEHYLDKLRTTWKIPVQVKLFLSEYLDVPVVIGYLKPVIYLPLIAATNLTPEQIEAVLLHELAHIKRYDFVANIFQAFIETILFFNPFVWLISTIIRRERENSCDDLVLSAAAPALYAETLLALAESQLYKGNFVLAAAGKKQQLFQRIKRIMEMKTKKLNIMQKLLVIFILATGIISVSWLVPGKKKEHQQVTKPAIAKTAESSFMQHNEDTALLPVPPAPPVMASVLPATVPSAPVPPPAPVRVPAPPVVVMASMDTFPINSWNDSSIKNRQHQMQQYFNSDAWKKYQQDLQAYQQHIQQYFQSAEWKAYRNALRAEANKMSEMFNNHGWKANMDSLKQKLFTDRLNMDSLMAKNRFKFSFDRIKMDSLMAEVKEKWDLASVHHPNMFLFSYRHTVNPNEIVRMMEQDGLIKNERNFSIRINEKGLYINGKKQSHASFEKYRDIIGTNTHLEIKKQGTHLKSSMNTKEKDNNSSL